MLIRTISMGAIALGLLFTIWSPRPGERPRNPVRLALYDHLPPLGMITPRRRYDPPYQVKSRGSGRRHGIFLRSLG